MSTAALTIPRTVAELLKLIQAKSTDPKVYEEYMAYAKKVEEALNLRKSLIAKIVEEITTNRVSINELRKAGLKISNASLSAEVEGSGDSAESAEDKVKREGNIVFGNDKFNWTRDLEVNAKNALFKAFKDGKSVKFFFNKLGDKRSGPGCLNNFPRFISGHRASYKRCKAACLAGQLGKHHNFHFRQLFLAQHRPAWPACPGTLCLARSCPALNAAVASCTSQSNPQCRLGQH